LPYLLASLSPSFANRFNGMVETDSSFNFIRAKDFSSMIDNPFQLTYTDDLFLALPNGKLLIQTQFEKTAAYFAGVDYAYPADPAKNAIAIVETDANWNVSKFIAGGKTTLLSKQYLTAFNSTYCMSAGFSNFDVFNQSLPGSLPTTSYGTVNLIGFNAASDFNTAYSAVVTSTSNRADIAIVQTKSENFPTIGSTAWLGLTNNWNTSSNWSNGMPTVAMKALFNAPTVNYPTVSTAPTAATLQVNAGVNLPLPNNLVLVGGLKNDGGITINNAGTFQGFGTKEWRGNGTVTFTGSQVNNFYGNAFTNSIILSTNFATQYDLRIPTIMLNNAKLNLGNKKLIISNSSTNAISGENASSYIYGYDGTIERAINSTGSYIFPMGLFTNAQTVIVEGAITGTTPNTTISGVAITSALDGGWFSINPNQQPTAGNYDVTLKIQASTNLSPAAGNYVVIKRNNATSPWATAGNYNVATTGGGIVTIKNSNLTSFSDFAIGRAASDVSLSNDGFSKNLVSVYPNPTSNNLNLSFESNLENASIKIISILGQTVFEKQNISGKEQSIDVSNLNLGLYIIEFSNGSTKFNAKFIKN
jgi:hypothetical protein